MFLQAKSLHFFQLQSTAKKKKKKLAQLLVHISFIDSEQ